VDGRGLWGNIVWIALWRVVFSVFVFGVRRGLGASWAGIVGFGGVDVGCCVVLWKGKKENRVSQERSCGWISCGWWVGGNCAMYHFFLSFALCLSTVLYRCEYRSCAILWPMCALSHEQR